MTNANTKMNTLTKNWFGHLVGEKIEVIQFMGSGLFRVRFSDGSTDIIGRSSFGR